MNKLFEERERINQLYDAPGNRRIKYSAIAVISIVIILLLSLTIWIDKIPPKTMMIMRRIGSDNFCNTCWSFDISCLQAAPGQSDKTLGNLQKI